MMLFYFLENLDFVEGSLHVMGRTFLYFHCNICFKFKILAKPDCRKMTPSQLLNHHISIQEHFPNVNWMISSCLIILNPFVF